jgi:hypothetical protein
VLNGFWAPTATLTESGSRDLLTTVIMLLANAFALVMLAGLCRVAFRHANMRDYEAVHGKALKQDWRTIAAKKDGFSKLGRSFKLARRLEAGGSSFKTHVKQQAAKAKRRVQSSAVGSFVARGVSRGVSGMNKLESGLKNTRVARRALPRRLATRSTRPLTQTRHVPASRLMRALLAYHGARLSRIAGVPPRQWRGCSTWASSTSRVGRRPRTAAASEPELSSLRQVRTSLSERLPTPSFYSRLPSSAGTAAASMRRRPS